MEQEKRERYVRQGFKAVPFEEFVRLIASAEPGIFFLLALVKPTGRYFVD
jgi:hypothetical protein